MYYGPLMQSEYPHSVLPSKEDKDSEQVETLQPPLAALSATSPVT